MYFTLLHFCKIVFVSDMFRVFTTMVYFILLRYMILKPLVRTLPFRLNNLFYKVSCIFCCMFLRGLGKHLLLRLNKIVYQFTFFVILDQLLHFYCIVFSLYKWNLLKCNTVKYIIKTSTFVFTAYSTMLHFK